MPGWKVQPVGNIVSFGSEAKCLKLFWEIGVVEREFLGGIT